MFDYQYNLTDHLGNVRNVLNASGTSVQSNDYYPFGLTHNTVSNLAKNKYLYNGKEAQDELIGGTIFNLLDYHARSYDPVIGKFDKPDRFTEKYVSLSPFQYAANNPISNIDVNGDSLMIFVNGVFSHIADDGKKEYTGYYQNFDDDGNSIGGGHFQFADPENDPISVKNGEITNLVFMSNADIEGIINAQGGFEKEN